MEDKGPLDRLAELEAKRKKLKEDIAAGKSGDGKTRPDLNQQLKILDSELGPLRDANSPRRMYPNSKHN